MNAHRGQQKLPLPHADDRLGLPRTFDANADLDKFVKWLRSMGRQHGYIIEPEGIRIENDTIFIEFYDDKLERMAENPYHIRIEGSVVRQAGVRRATADTAEAMRGIIRGGKKR